jgi:hypothetical protein
LLQTAAQELLSSSTHGPIRLPSSRKTTSPDEDSILDILSIEFHNRYEVAHAKLLRRSFFSGGAFPAKLSIGFQAFSDCISLSLASLDVNGSPLRKRLPEMFSSPVQDNPQVPV